MKLVILAIAAISSQSKVLFNKDMTINGTLTAKQAKFDQINVGSFCNVDELLSAEHIQASIVDAKEIYVNVIHA